MNILWFFLPGILYLGIVTSYTDIKYGLIRNKDIVFAVIYAFAAYLSAALFFIFRGTLHYSYFLELGANAMFALALAFGLWHYKIWSAGDGKLFFAFALLLPLEVYQYGRYSWFPSIVLLFNVFIIGLFFAVLVIIKTSKRKNYHKISRAFFKKFFEPKQLFKSITNIFVLFWFVQFVLSYFGVGGSLLLKYSITILFVSFIPKLISTFLKSKSAVAIIFVTLAILRLAIDRSVYSLGFLWEFILLIFVWKLLRNLFRVGLPLLGRELFSQKWAVSKLKPGMIMTEKIVKVKKLNKKKLKQLAEKKLGVFSRGKFLYICGFKGGGETYIDVEPEGLTKKDINKIKRIGFKTIKVQAFCPFAPLVFVGVIATLIAKGNVLILIRLLFY